METTIGYVHKVSTWQFKTDALHSFYDFEKNEYGEVIISDQFIEDLYRMALMDLDEIPKAREVLAIADEYEVDPELHYNFHIFLVKGMLWIEIGHRLKDLKNDFEQYSSYLDQLEASKIQGKIVIELNC